MIINPIHGLFAYIGPGVGAGIFAVIAGILASIFMAVVGIFWYPIKRLIKKIRGKKS